MLKKDDFKYLSENAIEAIAKLISKTEKEISSYWREIVEIIAMIILLPISVIIPFSEITLLAVFALFIVGVYLSS